MTSSSSLAVSRWMVHVEPCFFLTDCCFLLYAQVINSCSELPAKPRSAPLAGAASFPLCDPEVEKGCTRQMEKQQEIVQQMG